MIAAPYRKARVGRYVVPVERLRFVPVIPPRVFLDGSVAGALCIPEGQRAARGNNQEGPHGEKIDERNG